MLKNERKKAMSEAKKQPTVEEAIKWLQGYIKQRMMSHNMTVQCLFNAISALQQLPSSPDRDLCIADFERRLNEYVGDGAGKDAQVTFALSKLLAVYEPKETAAPVETTKAPDSAEQEAPVGETADEVADIIKDDDKVTAAPEVSEDEKEGRCSSEV